MYEELVKRLRTCGNSLSCNKCKWSSNCGGTGEVLRKAADAIEGLSGLIDHYGGETGLKNLQEYASKYWDLLKNAPRWISVKERLPECDLGAEVGNIEWISCGMVFAGCFGRGGKYRDAYFRTWTDGTEGIDAKGADYWRAVTLPEPPKEE